MSSAAALRKARRIVASHSPAQVFRRRAGAEDEFDFLLSDALVEALREAREASIAKECWSLTPAGHASLASLDEQKKCACICGHSADIHVRTLIGKDNGGCAMLTRSHFAADMIVCPCQRVAADFLAAVAR